jgi:hypothetical protein
MLAVLSRDFHVSIALALPGPGRAPAQLTRARTVCEVLGDGLASHTLPFSLFTTLTCKCKHHQKPHTYLTFACPTDRGQARPLTSSHNHW